MTTPAGPTTPARSHETLDAVHADIEIAAPPEDVFQALTDPEQLAAWWGSEETYRTRDWQIDARPGGAWSARTTDSSGRDGTVHGRYLAVDAPRLLECTWQASWDDLAPTRIRYELTPAMVDGVSGTRLIVTHTGFADVVSAAASGVTQALGWAGTLETLARYMSGHTRSSSRTSPITIRSTRYRRRLARAIA
jgi:uncharacterized protein YndB with AHSA1/START domain